MLEIIETEIGNIPKHWKIVPFNKALKVKGRVGWKGYKTSDLRSDGPVVVGGTNIKANLYLDFSQTTYLSREKFVESPEIMLQKGDVILVTRGNGIGDVGYYDGQFSEATINPSLVILSQFIGNPKYLFYYLNSPQGRFQVLSIAGGTSIPALYQGYINTLLCPIPPNDEQEVIVEILSCVDEKIDLLHRQNKTLEALAETLFRKYIIEGAVEAWRQKPVKELINILSGFAFKSLDFVQDGLYRLITIKSVQDGYMDLSKADYLNEIPSRMPDYCLLSQGDILLSLTGNVGRCCLVNEENLLLNQRVAKLKAKNHRDWAFTYIMFRQPTMKRMLEELAKGTAQANLSPIETGEIEIQIPPDDLLQTFSNEVTPLIEKVLKNKHQIKTLTHLRDTLLPKLMSGEVRIEN